MTRQSPVPDEWQGAAVPYPTEETVHSLFAQQAARRPSVVAVQDGEARLTYRELDERANQLAHFLRDRGIQGDKPVAVCMDRSIDFVITVLAILKAGGAYVPFSPDLPLQRIRFILEDVAPPLLITHRERFVDMTPAGVPVIRFDEDRLSYASCPKTPPVDIASAANLACLIFTSGSTGRPKGVAMTHRGVVQFLVGVDYVPMGEEHVFLLLASVSFDMSMFELWGALLHGARCVVYSEPELDFHRLGALIQKSGVSCLWLTTTLFNSFIDLDPSPLEGVSYLLTGGEALSVPHVCKALQALPATQIINGYGPCECNALATTYAVPRDFPADAKSVPIGRPITNARIYLLDPDMQPVPVGEPGELYVAKDNLSRGYYGRPELTAACFLPDPFRDKPGARMYKSGDRCRWLPDGNIEFMGRFDTQVKVRGFRIEVAEIEWVLSRHAAVRQSAVCVHGEGNARRLAAFVLLDEDTSCSETDLKAHAEEYLPDYMIPSSFHYVEAFPLTASGKTDRRALSGIAARASAPAASRRPPETDTERVLERIWAEVFALDNVGVEDDFFDLGGDSLKGASVLARISRNCRVDLKHRHLFDMPTIRLLAHYIDELPDNRKADSSRSIQRHRTGAPAPLSFEQEEVWSALQIHTGEPLFNEPFTLRIRESVVPEAMAHALNDWAARHEVCRTAIVVENGTPLQVVKERVEVPFRVEDVQDSPPDAREPKAERLATAETRKPFRLDQPPLLRALLVRLDEANSRLYLIMHHVITDAWTFYDVMIPELWQCYRARLAGAEPSLGPPPLQYADYARWQRSRMHGAEVQARLAAWRERFLGAQALALTPDRRRPSAASCRGASHYIHIGAELMGQMKDLARQENATLFMALLTGMNVLLSRYTEQDDIVLGTAVDYRNVPELETTAGCFVRALPVRTHTGGDPPFRELLRRVRDVLLETYGSIEVPFVELTDALHSPGSPSRQELLRVTCVMEPPAPSPPPSWEGQQVEIQTGTAKFDLLVEFEERDTHVIVRVERNIDLYEAETVERMLRHLLALLESASTRPEQPIKAIPLLRDEEMHACVQSSSGECPPFPRDDTVHRVFARQVAGRQEAVAVVDGQTALSYRELNRRANRFAHHLIDRGVAQGDSVALCMDRSWEYIVAVVGVLKAGAVYVPIDPTLPERRADFLLTDAGVALLYTHHDCGSQWSLPNVEIARFDDVGSDIDAQPDTDPPDTACAESVAYIMYTSGSTGHPKGVEIPHRGIVRLVCGADYVPFDENLTSLLLATVGFDASTFELWAPLLNGGRCVVYSRRDIDFTALEQAIHHSGVTCLWLTAALFNAVIDSRPQLLAPVHHVLTGGEALSVPHVRRALAELPDTRIINGYGPTENTTFSCTFSVPRNVPEYALSVPIGRPIANTTAYVLDPRRQPVPLGVPGELYVGGDGLARGYRNRPELTDERFVPDPFSGSPGPRMYRTGDRCRWLPDGNIEFLGRLDNQVKLRGYRVEPGEIEAMLQQHPAIAQCAIVVRGEGDARKLLAYVVSAPGANSSANGLRAHLAERLPGYMVPARFLFLETLPLTPNGKIDRDALPDFSDLEREYVAPRTQIERALARIWQEIFAVDRIGVTDDFFDLGGHSIRALAIAAAVERHFGRPVPLTHFFTAPTIAQLAVALENGDDSETSGKAVRLAGAGSCAPLFCIPGVGGTVFSFKKAAAEIGRARPVYGLQYPGVGDGEVPLESIEAVANELVRRMLEAEPEGPYHLLGYSLGGYVAFEAARELAAMGRRVALLGMIDCIAPNALAKRPWRQRLGIHLDQWWQAGTGARTQYVMNALRQRARVDGRHVPLVPEGESGLNVEMLQRLHRKMEQAGEQFRPGTYAGRAVLFRAVQPDWIQFTVMDDLMGWAPHVQGGVQVLSIPGSHLEVFEEPHLDVLISLLQRCLAHADKEIL